MAKDKEDDDDDDLSSVSEEVIVTLTWSSISWRLNRQQQEYQKSKMLSSILMLEWFDCTDYFYTTKSKPQNIVSTILMLQLYVHYLVTIAKTLLIHGIEQ